MTRKYQYSVSIPVKQTVHGVLFSARLAFMMSRLLLRKVLRNACMQYARKVYQRKRRARVRLPDSGEMAKQEWYSLSELEVIYGVSRRTLGRILKEAEKQGRPVRFYDMTKPEKGGNCSRRRPCVRINRKSLDEYLEVRFKEGEEE